MGKINKYGKLFWASVLLMMTWCYFAFFCKAFLLHQNDKYLFLFTSDYLHQFLNMPGGVAQWLSTFLTQFYHYPILGASLIAILICSVYLLLTIVFSKLDIPFENSYALLSCVILILILQNYESSVISTIAVILNLLMIIGFKSVNQWWLRIIVGLLAVVTLYFITGGFFWLFVITSLAFELLIFKSYQRFINALILLAFSLFMPYYMALNHFYIFIEPAYLFPVQTKQFDSLWYYGVFLLLVALALISSKVKFRISKKVWVSQFVTVLVFSFGLISIIINHNTKVHSILCIAQAGKNQQWQDVLEITSKRRVNNILVPYYSNLALAHKGELLNKLFHYPQQMGPKGLFHTWLNNQHLKQHGGVFFYDIGYVNEAHHWAFESLVETGPVAPVLKDLVRYNIVLGKTENAQKYLNVLKQSLFYNDWACEMEKLSEDTTLLNQPSWVQSKRKQIPSGDFFMDLKGYEKDLLNIVQRKPNNKLAFDYLIAYYLLSNQPHKILERMSLLKKHYKALPVAVQEVCTVYAPEMVSDQSVIDKYQAYKMAMGAKQRFNSNLDLKNTYWFYRDFIFPNQD